MLDGLNLVAKLLNSLADDGVRVLIRLALWRADEHKMHKTVVALTEALNIARREESR